METIFDFDDYKRYLKHRLPTEGSERGSRSQLARHLNCQPAFVSQVLSGKTHFSLEHAAAIDDFLEHSESESRFFMLLVHEGRSGSVALRRYYHRQLTTLRLEREQVSSRVQPQGRLSPESAHQYYSSWYYAAIHVLILVKGLRTKSAIAERLGLSASVVSEALEFLQKEGLVEETEEGFVSTSQRVHLGNDSSMIHKHHTNWRVRSLHALDSKDAFNLHYSGPIALSRKNAEKLRGWLLELIERIEPVLAEPGEEELYGLALDIFKV